MIERLRSEWNNLAVQMVVSFVALVVLTAAAAGIPAIWVMHGQAEQQAWELADQGGSTTQALLAARQSDLTNLAILTAQRPTLLSLVEAGDKEALGEYLDTLRTGAGLGLLLVCRPGGNMLALAGLPAEPGAQAASERCTGEASSGYANLPGAGAWLLASQPMLESKDLNVVVAGKALDQAFLESLSGQTGLEQTLLVNGQPAGTSLAGGLEAAEAFAEGEERHSSTTLGGELYYSVRLPLGASGLEQVVTLPVGDITEAQRRLTWIIAGSLVVVALAGSGFGVLRARRISRPLRRLAAAAGKLRQGDLATPVSARTRLREVALVAYALDDARSALQVTLSQLRREKAWIDHLLEAVVEGIVTLDPRGRITFFSPGAERISGWKAEKAAGKLVDEVFQPAESQAAFSALIPRPGQRQKITVRLRDARETALSITGASLAPPETGRSSVALVMRDVSDEEAMHRLLGDFLANISHEFRTPLAALDASIELLMDQLPDLSQAEMKDLLGSLHLGILSLQTLIDNLLEGASIETGRFRVAPRPAAVGEIVAGAVELMQPLLDKYDQRMRVDIPDGLPAVQADTKRTCQVIVNLLSNAIKWNPPNGEIDLRAEAVEVGVKVTVADRGPGVPPQAQPELFRRFVHVDSGSGRAEYGAGLGLSVVKAIVEAQGGEVGVRDRAGGSGGAAFWFTLPAAEPEAGSAQDLAESIEGGA